MRQDEETVKQFQSSGPECKIGWGFYPYLFFFIVHKIIKKKKIWRNFCTKGPRPKTVARLS